MTEKKKDVFIKVYFHANILSRWIFDSGISDQRTSKSWNL